MFLQGRVTYIFSLCVIIAGCVNDDISFESMITVKKKSDNEIYIVKAVIYSDNDFVVKLDENIYRNIYIVGMDISTIESSVSKIDYSKKGVPYRIGMSDKIEISYKIQHTCHNDINILKISNHNDQKIRTNFKNPLTLRLRMYPLNEGILSSYEGYKIGEFTLPISDVCNNDSKSR